MEHANWELDRVYITQNGMTVYLNPEIELPLYLLPRLNTRAKLNKDGTEKTLSISAEILGEDWEGSGSTLTFIWCPAVVIAA